MTAITAGLDVPYRRRPVAGSTRPEVVVRLHPQGPPRRSTPSGPVPVSSYPGPADLDQLTRAVHALVEALAPGLVAEVSVRAADGPRPALIERAELPATPASQRSALTDDDQIRLDEVSRTLLVDGRPAQLTRREFELLAHLASNPGVAMSRRDLMSAVWHDRYLPGDRTVDVHIRRVRVKLGAHAGRLTTLRGYGYRFD